MSCFICDSKTISAITDLICKIADGYADSDLTVVSGNYHLIKAVSDCRDRHGYSEEAIYKKLYAENYKAFAGRYKDHQIDVIIPEYKPYSIIKQPEYDFVEKFGSYRVIKPWHFQMLKYLDCYLYQVDEDSTHNDELVSGIQELRNDFANTILRNIPEYITAEWN